MKKLNGKISATAILAMILLLTSMTFPDHALAARGVLKEDEDSIHFDLTLTVNITRTAFDITKKSFEDEKETWMKKWQTWKALWEDKRPQSERWREWMRVWESWKAEWKEEWESKWKAEWDETWKPEWKERWEDWEEWMEEWTARWREIKFGEMEKIPEFIRSLFRERMMKKIEDLWNKHMNASVLASSWFTPASRLGLKRALGESLNKTLQRIYNTSDVYIKNFNLNIELSTKTTLIDDAFMTMDIFNVTQRFDLWGVVIRNSSGTFIRAQYRHLNITEKIDGGKFGYPGWVFTPSKAMFMDLSVFSVPLEKWEKKFDRATNTTMFTLVKNINVTTPFGSVVVDPELSLVVPGDASGVGDMIVITPILPTNILPVRILVPTVAVATLTLMAYYLTKRKTMIQRGHFSLL